MVELHVQCGESLVQACGHAVVHRLYGGVYGAVGNTQLVNFAECQEGTEPQGSGGMGVYKRVSDEDAVFLADKNFLFGQNHSSHTVGHAGYILAVELTNILVSGRTDGTAFIAVYSQVERCPVLDNGLVER